VKGEADLQLWMSTILLGCVAAPAMAQSFPCSNASVSPYPALVTTVHDHQRVAPSDSGLTKSFTAYYSSFDDGKEGHAEVRHTPRLNPQFVL
jgi:hypothetical protein